MTIGVEDGELICKKAQKLQRKVISHKDPLGQHSQAGFCVGSSKLFFRGT